MPARLHDNMVKQQWFGHLGEQFRHQVGTAYRTAADGNHCVTAFQGITYHLPQFGHLIPA